MAEFITFELEGMAEILEALDDLESKQIMPTIKYAQRRTLNETIIPAVKNALTYRAAYKRLVGLSRARGRHPGYWAGILDASSKKGTKQRSKQEAEGSLVYGYILRFADLGTKARSYKGMNRGKIIGRNTIRPAISTEAHYITPLFQKYFIERLEADLQKKLKKLNK